MAINLLVAFFLKQVLAGIVNILLVSLQMIQGQRFQIQFDGIFRDANVWINGIYLGNNKSGYIGFAYDITDYHQL